MNVELPRNGHCSMRQVLEDERLCHGTICKPDIQRVWTGEEGTVEMIQRMISFIGESGRQTGRQEADREKKEK